MSRAVLGLITFILIACHHNPIDDPHAIIVALSSPPVTLDPSRATDATSERVTDLIFTSLVRNGPNLKPVPQAAVSWTVETKRITLTIRNDLTFHNGRPVSMDDVIYSFNTYRNSSSFGAEFANIESLRSDGQKLILKLKNYDATLLSNLAYVKILPREEIEKRGARFTDHPIGSGPYRFESMNNNRLVLKKWNGAPYAVPANDTLVFSFIRDENTRYLKIIKGDVDVLLNDLSEEKVAYLRKSNQVNVVATPGLNFNYLLLNLRDQRLKNPDVRKAFWAALTRDEVIKYKLENLAEAAGSILAPSNPYNEKNLKFPTLTLDEARAIIRREGLVGSSFSYKTSAQALPNAQIIAQQLERLGIKIYLQSFEWGTFYSDIKQGKFELATMRWVGITDPDIYRESLASTEFPPGKNRGYYDNKTFDAVVNDARREIDPVRRKALYTRAQQIIAADLPILPLWYNLNISLINKRLTGFTPTITGSFFPLVSAKKE